MTDATQGATKSSRSERAGLTLPVGRIHRHMRVGNFAPRVGGHAPVWLAAALEYVSKELLEISEEAASVSNKRRILPTHIQSAIRKDEDLARLFSGVTVWRGGVRQGVSAFAAASLKNRKRAKKKKKRGSVKKGGTAA